MLLVALAACFAQDVEAPRIRTFVPVCRREVLLGEHASPAEIRHVIAFGFDAESRLRFVRREDDGVALVRLASDGRVRSAAPVDTAFAAGRELAWYPLVPPHWLAVVASWEQGAGQAWRFDEDGGAADELAGFPSGAVERVLPLDAARWLVHADARALVYDVAGQRAEPLGTLRAADDLAVTSDGRIVSLHGGTRTLRFWRPDGGEDGSVLLEKVWDEPGHWPAVVADADGGVIVRDFRRLLHVDLDGRLRAAFDARMADGTARADYRRNLRVAPDGRMWTTDGEDLLRLGADGTADLALRGQPRVEALEAPCHGAIDTAFGRIVLQDARTRALHVFEASGAHVLACRPPPEELEELDRPLALRPTPDGGLLASAHHAAHRPIRFGRDGVSRGIQELDLFGVAYVPGRDAYWGWRRWRPARIGPDGAREVELPHRPDGHRWRSIEYVAVSPSGELAVLDLPRRSRPGVPASGAAVIAVFDAEGTPRAQHELPAEALPSRLAFAGSRVLAHGSADPWLLDLRDGALWRLDVGAELGTVYPSDLGLGFAGEELWILHPARARLRVCSLPD